MNDKLYNDLLEYCNYDLKEVEETIKYFKNRLECEENYDEEESVWEKPLIEEIDMILNCNFDDYETGIELSDSDKKEIVYDIINYEDELWEEIHMITLERVKKALVERYMYLIKKQKVCELDKEERKELENLINCEVGE